MAKHMTQDDRKTLEARYNSGQSVAGIARAMRFNYSTIYKELKRGDTGKMDANGRAGYSAALGQQRLYNKKQQLRYWADRQERSHRCRPGCHAEGVRENDHGQETSERRVQAAADEGH